MNDADSVLSEHILTFHLNAEAYGIDIMSMREIRGWTRATALPHAPPHVLGVINLRGTVLPVIDLKRRLGFPRTDPTARSVVLVVNHDTRLAGLLVDAVSDIVPLPGKALQPPPTLPQQQGETMLLGLTLITERLIRVLDLPAVLGCSGELAA